MSKNPQDEDFVRELTNHQGDLFFFIRSLCGDPDAAADIRQAANMILWRKRSAFQPGTNFKAWAFRVAHLEVKTYLRKAARNKCFHYDPEFLDSLATEIPAIIEEFSARRRALAECLKSLTPKDNELIRHHYYTDGTLETLADQTGRSTGTLKARLFQLRAKLKLCIQGKLAQIQIS